ncbi:MAG: hypothetical protein ABJC04_12755, partial [Verrucomicrobiota bacterium]
NNTKTRYAEVDNFRVFMGDSPLYTNTTNLNLVVQTPFNPVLTADQTISWEINDPLVHYMAADLLTPPKSPDDPKVTFRTPATDLNAPSLNLGKINNRYRPWGRKTGGGDIGPLKAGITEENDFAYDYRLKDARVRWSDDWNFPSAPFPNIGFLGKVHRGTPWQTIYLKADAAPTNDWKAWSGSYESHPTQDWKLMDLFYTAPNDNAARGLLSVNQTNLAAWSAALSGMVLVTNAYNNAVAAGFGSSPTPLPFQSYIIQPNEPVAPGDISSLEKIVRDINETRRTNYGGVFPSLGSILSVPSLSINSTNLGGGAETLYYPSPFINVGSKEQRIYGLNDDAYERIPRQLMSLLKLGKPQYVIYCYGQSLKPANNSLALDVPDNRLFNICTNYQITGEVVTRTVLRVEGPINQPKIVIQSYNVLPGE